MKRILQMLNNITLRKKLLFILSFATFLVGISSLLAINNIMNANNQLLHRSIATSLAYSSNEINTILNAVNTTSYFIISDNTIQESLDTMLTARDNSTVSLCVRSIYDSIHPYLYNSGYLSYVTIYQENIRISSSGYYPYPLTEGSQKQLITEADSKNGKIVWSTSEASTSGVFLARNIRKIKNLSLDTLGTLIFRLDMDKIIYASTRFGNDLDHTSFILLDGDTLLYSTMEHIDINKIQNIKKDYEILDLNGEKYFAVRRVIPDVNWNYICLVPYSSTFQIIQTAYTTSMILIFVSILIAIWLSDSLVRNITKHLEILVKKITAFSGENTEVLTKEYDYTKRQDELGLIHNHFDSMAVEIQNLINDNYVKQLLIKDAQLKALETQINPHFLYNILESVNWRAKAIGETRISDMVEALGHLLRATLSKGSEIITIEKELEFIQSYITIQQIRFEERLHFHMNIDPDTLSVPIPKLSIQPLIENAIHYSLERNTEECNIYLEACIAGDVVKLSVKNDGSQFEDHLMENLSEKKVLPHGLGIGLTSIHSRIKLHFGKEYGILLLNEEDLAVVIVTIPFKKIVKE